MTQLRPNEVSQKFKSENRFEIQPRKRRRENSRPNHVDRAVDRPVDRGVDLLVDLPVDTACRARGLGCTRSGFLARAGF